MSPSKGNEEKSYVFCYYVSGHGFGHATRVVQIASEILSLSRSHTTYIISNAPRFIFQSAIDLGAQYRHALIDAGVQQPLPYTVDRERTIKDLTEFLEKREEMLEIEVNWLKEVKADIVLSDAPFLPCAAATAAGIPSSIVSNFTFDAVYHGLCEGDELDITIRSLVERVVADYKNSELLIRLPGYIPLPAFPGTQLYPNDRILVEKRTSNRKGKVEKNGVRTRKVGANGVIIHDRKSSTFPSRRTTRSLQKSTTSLNVRRVIDVPLVVRKYKKPREDVLRDLNIPCEIFETHKVLLVSFGGQKVANNKEWGEPLPDGWIAIVCGAWGSDGKTLPDRFYKCPVDAYFPDLTNAASVVMGKLGYGTCSECIGHSKPFIYVSRPQFIEEMGLKSLMLTHGSCVEIPKEHFETGRWQSYILKASTLSGRCEDEKKRLGHDGGKVAANLLEKFLDDRMQSIMLKT